MTAAPSQIVTNLASLPDPSPKLAKLGDRFLAAILDTLIVVSPMFFVGMLLGERYVTLTPRGYEVVGGPAVLAILFGVAIWFSYFWAAEGLFGTTVGKFLIAIRVQDDKGRELSVGQSYIRTLLRFIDGIGFYFVSLLIAVASEKRQRLGDMAAKTLVVEADTPLRKQRLAAVCALIAVIASCLALAVLIRHL